MRALRLVLLIILSCSLVWPVPASAFFLGGMTIRDEKELGRKFEILVRSSMPVVDDPEVTAYVSDLMHRLLKSVPPQPFTFHSSVILHNALNAFAVPGGNLFVFTGLIMNLDNEAELAGVIAHEIAHVTQRHLAAQVEKSQFVSLGSLLLAVAGIALGGAKGAPAAYMAVGAGQAAMLKYSRLDETEADNVGLQYLVAAGYPPSGMVGGFAALRKKSRMNGISIPTYLSTHPDIGDRMNSIGAYAATMPASVRNRAVDNSRFKRVQTLLWARYGDPQAALLRFADKDSLSRMGRGMVLSRQNNVVEAAAAFDEAVRLAPDDPLVLREAGIFNFQKGSMEKAERLLATATQLDRKDYLAAFYMGRVHEESGNEKQAVKTFRDVLKLMPEDPETHEALARCLARDQDEPGAYLHMTYAAMYGNKRQLAEQYFNRAKTLASSASARRELEKLETTYKERKEIWEKS